MKEKLELAQNTIDPNVLHDLTLNTNYGLLIKYILDNPNTSARTLHLIYENRKKYYWSSVPCNALYISFYIVGHPNTSLELLHEMFEDATPLGVLHNIQYARAATEEFIIKCRAKLFNRMYVNLESQ
jgi:hypothetical protein